MFQRRNPINFSVTNQIIIFNIIVFFASYLILISNPALFENIFALTPLMIISGKNLWTLFTSMFAHAGFFHIFANMFSLFFIGNFLEKIIGRKRFFWIYIVSGLVGGLFFTASGFLFGNNTPGIGASGAIFGALGVLAVLVPYSRIYLIAGPLILILVEAGITPFVSVAVASYLGFVFNLLIILMIFAIFSWNPRFRRFAIPLELPMWLLPIVAIVPLVIIGFFVTLPIGNSAHIGGLAAGVLYGFYLRQKFPRKTRRISNYFS